MKIRIGVLFGGQSGEHEVSLMSARSVMGVLDAARYEVYPIAISRSGEWFTGEETLEKMEAGSTQGLLPVGFLPYGDRGTLYALGGNGSLNALAALAHLDVVFIALHGPNGEDGVMQGLLQAAGVPYVGAGVLASAAGMDKALFKDLMRAHHIPVTSCSLFTRRQLREDMEGVVQACEALGAYPFFVKPCNLGSSVGISKCRDHGQLAHGLREAARFDRRVLVEVAVRHARELEVGVLGDAEQAETSVVGEIVPHDEFYTYSAKYSEGGSNLVIPADLSPDTAQNIRSLALSAFHAVDCSGMARVDFLMDGKSGELFLSEINTIPGFTRTSMYPRLFAASGIPYPQLVERLVQLALERSSE